MRGVLHKTEQGWVVRYSNPQEYREPIHSLPLHPDDVKQINADAQVFDNIEARMTAYPYVEFEIFTVDNGAMSFTEAFESKQYAKIIISREEPKQTLQEYEQQGLEKYSYEFELEKSNENVINVLINDYVQELIDSKSVEAHERTWISSICYHVINKAQETLEERIREALKDSFSKGMIVQTGFDTNEESENMFIDKFIQSFKKHK
jgi:hypothetical protein